MYAVFSTGGKQYRAATGDRLKVEKLNAEEGDTITLDQVMMVTDGDQVTIGTPLVDGGAVEAKVLSHGRAKKIRVIKFRRRKHSRNQMGHRQSFTELEITNILASGAKPAKKAESKPKPAAKKADDKPAAKKPAAKPAKAAELRFLDGPNGTADDLKKISGVGPVLEKKLNALGIYHFSQIAAFTDEEIEQVDDALSFKGRITRDDWLGQAKILADGGETEFSKKK